MVFFFYRSLSDSKSPQVSRILLSIRTDLNNAVVWMVFTRPLITKPFNPCTNPLVTVPRAPITIGITVTYMFYSLFVFFWGGGSSKVYVLIFFFAFFQVYPVVSRNGKVHYSAGSLFYYLFIFVDYH